MVSANPLFMGVIFLSILLLATALYGWRSAPRTSINQRFAAQTLLVTCWAIGISGLHSGHATEFWGRWTFASAALMPPAFLAFTEGFSSDSLTVSRPVRWTTWILGLGFAVIATITPWIAHSFIVRDTVLSRTPGVLMLSFSVFFVASSILVLAILARKLRGASGVARVQLSLYFAGLLLFCTGAITTNLILPYLLDDSRYSILGPWFVLVFLAFVAHGIIRYRFMNLRLVIHSWLTISIASAIALMPLALVLALLHAHASRSSFRHSVFDDLAILVCGAVAIPLWLITRTLLYRYVYRGDTDFRRLVSQASERLARTLSPQEISGVISETIAAAVRPDKISIYVRRKCSGTPSSRQLISGECSIQVPTFLPESISSAIANGSVLVSRPHVAAAADEKTLTDATLALQDFGWALAIPLNLDSEMLGTVAIGEKLSGAPYYREDIDLLRVLIRQASVALKNGELFEEVLFANQQIENIVATIESGIVVFHSDSDIRILNEAAVRLLGLNQTFAPISSSIAWVPAAFAVALQQSLISGARVFELTLDRGSETVPLMCATSILRGSSGETVGVVVAITDVSLVNALEVERSRAERLNYYESLAATLAHEIANPLAPIKAMTQLLLERSKDPAFVVQSVRIMVREVDRMERLVDRLRVLSRPTNYEKRPLNVSAVVEEAIAVMRPLLADRNIEIRLSRSEEESRVLGDADDLHELFLNLLTNAAEATGTGASVEVSISHDLCSVAVAIADCGPGIPAELADRLFEPFMSSKNRGSGLGLTVCHGIVTRHGGQIEASNHTGGALFTVKLPLATGEHISTEPYSSTI